MPIIAKGRLVYGKDENALLSECRVEVLFDFTIPAEVVEPAHAEAPLRFTSLASEVGDRPSIDAIEEPLTPAGTTDAGTPPAVVESAAATPTPEVTAGTRRRSTRSAATAAVEPPAASEPATSVVRGRVSTRTDRRGAFRVELPDEEELATRTLQFVVSAPSGQTIADVVHPIGSLDDEIRILVRKVEAIPLTPPDDVPEPATQRLTGRVLEQNAKPLPGGLQILLFARPAADPTEQEVGAHPPVFVARADSTGYFTGDAPTRKYGEAAALVSGFPDEIKVGLEEGRLPPHVVLVVDLDDREETTDQGTDDGACSDAKLPSRLPTYEDFENSPESYSVDLGTGRCVQFNTPNRAIEEYSFYTVVRTTEPDIIGLTLTDDGVADRGAPPKTAVPLLPAAPGSTLPTAPPTGVVAPVATAYELVLETGERGTWGAILINLLTKTGESFTVLAKDSVNGAGGLFPNLNDPGLAALVLEAGSRRVVRTTQNDGSVTAIGLDLRDVRTVEVDWIESNNGDGWSLRGIGLTATTADGGNVPILINGSAPYTLPQAFGFRARDLLDTSRDHRKWVASASFTAPATGQAVSTSYAMTASNVPARQVSKVRDLGAVRDRWSKLFEPPARAELDRNNRVDWDATPTFYEAATIAHGHLLHFKQIWFADGYSLGDLLYSLPLAPGQKKLISVVDWERRETAERTEATFGSEQLSATLSRDRDLGEVVTATLTESSRGGSQSTSAGVGVGTGAAGNGSYQGMNFGALIGVSGGYGESNSNAWQDSARGLSTNSLQTLRDRTMQSASAIRGLRSSVVHTVAQGEAVRATTEVVANHNHCHALTIQYFEVLRHLLVAHRLVEVRECLFVPLPIKEFGGEMALRWRQPLQTYLQRRELAPAFDALRRVLTNWSEVDYPAQRYADEKIVSIAGELQLTVIIPMPPFPERPRPDPAETADEARKKIQDAVNPTTGPLGIILAIATGGASLVAGAVTDAAAEATKAVSQGARAIADELYPLSAQERYDKFQQEVMPGFVAGFVDQLELWAVIGRTEVRLAEADFTLVSDYQPGVPLLVSVRASLPGSNSRADHVQLRIKSANGLPTGCRAIVNNATFRYRTSSFEHALVDDLRVNDDLDLPKVTPVVENGWEVKIVQTGAGSGATLFTPIDVWEQRRPRLEDWRLAGELIDHLNDNLEFYHHAIWWTMDPNRRYMLLDGYQAPGSGGRSVASVVENKLIGIVGNSLVMPVAQGVQLDPRFDPVTGKREDLRTIYRPDPPVPSTRVSLPTRGVFAEAVQGSCNACEEIDETKFWRWSDAPIDEPPGIEPVSTATRRAEPSGVAPTPFPTPMVSIQNAPAAPDPLGVRAALDTIAKQAFADITGLAGTQANAAAAYSQALDTAFKFGKEASTLAQQAGMQKGIDKTMNAIDKADSGGKIDKDAAKDLRTTALKKLVGDSGDSTVDAADVKKRLDIISNASKDNQVDPNRAKDISGAVLKGLAPGGTSTDHASTMAGLTQRFDPKDVELVRQTSNDGTFEVRQTVSGPSVGSEGVGDSVRWWDLLRFRPPQALIDGLVLRDLAWQRINEGYGDVNLDFYAIEITDLPDDPATGSTFTAKGLAEYVRKNFAKILIEYPGMAGPSFVEHEAADKATWASDDPLGAVMKFRIDARPYAESYPGGFWGGMPLPEYGLVLCAEHVTDDANGDWHWNFVTVTGTGIIGYHPVSGTRQFGLRRVDGSHIFYIRAADRVTTAAEYALSPLVFSGGERYWHGFFANLEKLVGDNNGKATMGPSYSHRHNWGLVVGMMPAPPPST